MRFRVKRADRFRPVKTPVILQLETTECSAAALGIILAYHGRYVPLAELREKCKVTRDGANARNIKETAEEYGLEAKYKKCKTEELRELEPPYLIHWAPSHFLVVEGFKDGRVFLSDPATGRRSVDLKRFQIGFETYEGSKGFYLKFNPGMRFKPGGVKPSTWRRILDRLKNARPSLIYVVFVGLAVTACEIVVASFNRIFVDQILIEEHHDWVRPLLLAMGLTAAFRLTAGLLQQGALRRIKLGLSTSQSARFLSHLLELPVSFYQLRFAGEIAGRVDSNSIVADLISGPLANTSVGLLMVIVYALMMYAFDPLLMFVGVAVGCLNLVGIAFATQAIQEENLKLKQARGNLHGSLIRAIQVIETIKSASLEPEILHRLTGLQTRATNSSQMIGVVSAILIALPPFVLMLTTAVILGLGGYNVIQGTMSIGALLAFQTLLASFNRPFGDLVRLGSNVQSLQAELDRLDDVGQSKPDPIYNSPNAGASPSQNKRPERLSGHLELKNVTFGYTHKSDAPLIANFNLTVKAGTRVALVGASGSGKSTIGKLVAGLYRPRSGEILFDGIPIDQIPRMIFTKDVALVDDQSFLFSGTIRDNLTLWDETIPDRDMIQAANDARIHADLIKRRGGYDALIAENARDLSGGQRQRMEIARALIRNPSIVILDEATSALDPKTELLVDNELRRRGLTCLIIAHRLSTIRDCDEIVVLKQGNVIERGTHDDLMKIEEGFYRELQSLQDQSKPPGQIFVSDASKENDIEAPTKKRTRGFETGSYVIDTSMITSSKNAISALDTSRLDTTTVEAVFNVDNASLQQPDNTKKDFFTSLRAYGETVTTTGNRPLPLKDEKTVWLVEEGQVDLFYIHPEAGRESGSRRHLCRVTEGHAIFALEKVRGHADGELLAVGVGPTTLTKFRQEALVALSLVPELLAGVARILDEWIELINRAFEHTEPPFPMSLVVPDTKLPFERGASISAVRGVLWLKVPENELTFSNDVHISQDDYSSRFPICSQSWLTLGASGDVEACDTLTYLSIGDPWVGLQRFHRAILDGIAIERLHDRHLNFERLCHADSRDTKMHERSVDNLMQLVDPELTIMTGSENESDLLQAARFVAAKSGIELKQPATDVNADQPKTIADITALARISGCWIREVELSEEWWRTDGGPLLGFRNDNQRPVALIPASRSRYRWQDFSARNQGLVDASFAAELAPYALSFCRNLGDKKFRILDMIRFVMPEIRDELRQLLRLALFSGVVGLLAPIVLAYAVDDAIPSADVYRLHALSILLVVLGISIAASQALQGVTLVRIKGKLEATLIPAVWDRLLNLPARYFQGQESGEIALRALGIARMIEILTSTSIISLFIGSVAFLNLVVLLSINWRLALAAVSLNGLAIVAILVMLPAFWHYQRAIAKAQGGISSFLLVLVGGIARLRVAGAEKRAFAKWAELYHQQLSLVIRYQKLSDRLNILGDLWPLVTYMGVFASFLSLSDDGIIAAGAFLAFNFALSQGMASVLTLGKNVIPLLHGIEQYDRLRPIIEAIPETVVTRNIETKLAGAIRLEHVSFRYQTDGPLILDDINLQVAPGEFVAIVGPSGAGKSTILRLLLGFETPTQGVVAYDNRELFTFDVREVRKQIGVVLQDSQLFPGDIYSNIVGHASKKYTEKDAWNALKFAGLDTEVNAMPMKLHTVISEGGGGLSSGQRQRLMIARALVSRPKILLLDEATSSLDNLSQAVVQQSLYTTLRGTSRVAIAHRISTIIDADRIYVIKDGKIVQRGKYKELMKEKGTFQELAKRQTL